MGNITCPECATVYGAEEFDWCPSCEVGTCEGCGYGIAESELFDMEPLDMGTWHLRCARSRVETKVVEAEAPCPDCQPQEPDHDDVSDARMDEPSHPPPPPTTATCGECSYFGMGGFGREGRFCCGCRHCGVNVNVGFEACPSFVRRPKEERDDNVETPR